MNAIEAAERAGIDLTLIDETLRLTPEQRALQHQRALEMALQLKAGFEADGNHHGSDRAQPTSADPVRR